MIRDRDVRSIAQDLHNKIAHDVTSAAKLSLQLVSGNQALEMYLSSGAVVATGVLMAICMESDETRHIPINNSQAQEVADQALFGMLLSWFMETPDRYDAGADVDTVFRRAIKAWEAVKGKPFDSSWLDPELHKIAKDALGVLQ